MSCADSFINEPFYGYIISFTFSADPFNYCNKESVLYPPVYPSVDRFVVQVNWGKTEWGD